MITCDDCGNCCTTINSPPFLGMTELVGLPPSVRDDYRAGMDAREVAGFPDGVPCFWLTDVFSRCKYYEHRPDICREFEAGGKDCQAVREMATNPSQEEN